MTVANVWALEHTRHLADQLSKALGSRAVIDQAIGILLSRTGVSAQEAFQRLTAMSQNEGTKLVVACQTLVAQTISQARARRKPR